MHAHAAHSFTCFSLALALQRATHSIDTCAYAKTPTQPDKMHANEPLLIKGITDRRHANKPLLA